MLTRIGNLILASSFLFLVCFFYLGMFWPDNWRLLSPSEPRPLVEPMPFYETTFIKTICILVVFIWVFSAAFLFDRRRFAWFGSLLGVGSAVLLFGCLLIDGVCGGFDMDEDMWDLSGDAFVVRMISAFVYTVIWLMFCVAVFIGLIKNRKELI
jgi:hypothetical protein